MIERYVVKPRHIEIQIIADQHGNVYHLFERECSTTSSSKRLSKKRPVRCYPEMRAAMGQAAVNGQSVWI